MTTLIKCADEKEWKATRQTGIGASDAPVIMGLSPWRTPLQLYADKLGLLELAPEESEAMRWGRRLEPVICEAYAEATGRHVKREAPWTIHRSDPQPFMLASLDAWTMRMEKPEMGVLEVKTHSAFRAEEWAEGPPLMYQVQVQHQLAVTGAKWGAIVVLIGGQSLRWADIPRHEDFISRLIEKEQAFWERLQAKEPPQVDDSEATKKILRALYPQETPGLVVNLPGEAVEWDAAVQQAKADLKAAETTKRLNENLLKAAIGEAEAGALPDGTLWKWTSRDVKGYMVEPRVDRVLSRKAPK